ncbi:MAG: hypothetical protein ACKO34_03575 [Vampirovibrionales bacterium]
MDSNVLEVTIKVLNNKTSALTEHVVTTTEGNITIVPPIPLDGKEIKTVIPHFNSIPYFSTIGNPSETLAGFACFDSQGKQAVYLAPSGQKRSFPKGLKLDTQA